MHPIIYYILFFLAIGGIGMAVANRKVSISTRRQRWLKYCTYIVFTGIVILSILYNCLWVIGSIIILAALAEIVKVNYRNEGLTSAKFFYALLFFLPVAIGFVYFTISFSEGFLLFIYFQVLVFDGFCQIIGQLFGKHKLAISISPSKTWEGFIGGWLFCCFAAIMAHNWVPLSVMQSLIFGIVTGICSFCGDMIASWYKRVVRVKDYSNWLPGQGGFLDRFDSFLVTGMTYYLIYIIILKTWFHLPLLKG